MFRQPERDLIGTQTYNFMTSRTRFPRELASRKTCKSARKELTIHLAHWTHHTIGFVLSCYMTIYRQSVTNATSGLINDKVRKLLLGTIAPSIWKHLSDEKISSLLTRHPICCELMSRS